MTTKRTYMVLIERPVDDRFGDHAFVLLGMADATRPDLAVAEVIDGGLAHELPPGSELVVVPAGHWRTHVVRNLRPPAPAVPSW